MPSASPFDTDVEIIVDSALPPNAGPTVSGVVVLARSSANAPPDVLNEGPFNVVLSGASGTLATALLRLSSAGEWRFFIEAGSLFSDQEQVTLQVQAVTGQFIGRPTAITFRL